jgi:hypothetical protein
MSGGWWHGSLPGIKKQTNYAPRYKQLSPGAANIARGGGRAVEYYHAEFDEWCPLGAAPAIYFRRYRERIEPKVVFRRTSPAEAKKSADALGLPQPLSGTEPRNATEYSEWVDKQDYEVRTMAKSGSAVEREQVADLYGRQKLEAAQKQCNEAAKAMYENLRDPAG